MKSHYLLLLTLLITGCQSLHRPLPPVCDGRHRRPANPPVSATAEAGPGPMAPAPWSSTPSPRLDLESLKPCGGRP